MEEKVSIEQEIRNYIINNKNSNYNTVLAEDERWEVFFHLSEMRKSLLGWYQFSENAKVLEIGGGFGALTGVLCDKCEQVTVVEKNEIRAESIKIRYQDAKNLTVITDDILSWKTEERFDYIILIGVLETICNGNQDKDSYSQFLKEICKYMKVDGKILIAVENRYGIRYFCGATDRYTGQAFSGINHYPCSSSGYTFDKQELTSIIEGAGLQYHKFYYPLPDYILPQVIFSEEYIPTSSVKERVIPYYYQKAPLVAYENDLYDDLIRNGVLDFFSNSFLIECGNENEFCDVIYATMTTDRGEEAGFVTTIHENDTVRKAALYDKGKESIAKVYQNIINLQERGIKCIPHVLKNDYVEMPFVSNHTLSEELRKIACDNPEEFISVFDKLYQYILQSSDSVDNDCNQMEHPLEISKEELGPILRYAYIDMVPFNCFYQNGDLVFFDQEFVREFYPAKYVLYRALKYTYFFNSKAKEVISLEEMKIKYCLQHLWECFEAEERRFVAENRQYNVYHNFRKWAAVNKSEIYKRGMEYGRI